MMRDDVYDEQFGFCPWIEVDAKAKPMSSGMVHMSLGPYFRIGLPKSIKREPRERQLEVLKEAVRKHRDWLVEQNQNPLQAAPRRYICHINSADDIIELTPNGEIIREARDMGCP